MAAWGPGLYSDDTTCEIRDEFKEALESGRSHADAAKGILKRYKGLLKNNEVACLVYFSLADVQWKYGCLEPAVKQRALALIDAGGDVKEWQRDAPKAARARAATLKTLKARLLSRQPPRRAIEIKKPGPPRALTAAPVGAIFAVTLPNGKLALLKLVGFYPSKRVQDPVFNLLAWQGKTVPAGPALQAVSRNVVQLYGHPEFALLASDGRKNPLRELQDTGRVVKHKGRIDTGSRRIFNFASLPEKAQAAIAGAAGKTRR